MDGHRGMRLEAERRARWEARQASWGGPIFRGRARPGPGDLVLSRPDYLALGRHPRVVGAQVAALTEHGDGPLPPAVHRTDEDGPTAALARRLAGFLSAPAVVLTQSGWAANTSVLQSVAAPREPVYVDVLAHGGFRTGIEAADAVARLFPHHDVEYLELLIKRHGPGLIAVSSLYGVTGDLCPLPELVAVAEKTGCRLVVDESHALGVLGPGGTGYAARLGLTDRIDFRTASLGKAFASRAGLIACPSRVAGFLPFHAHPAVFSAGLQPHDVAGLDAVLDLVVDGDARRERLTRNAEALRDGLTVLGYEISPSTSHIIPLQPGTEAALARFQGQLDGEGVFGAAFIPPAVAQDRCVHRLCAHSDLGEQDLIRILDACARVRDASGMREWMTTRRLRSGSTAAARRAPAPRPAGTGPAQAPRGPGRQTFPARQP